MPGLSKKAISYRMRKIKTFLRMGGRCIDCGTTDWRVIQFDHITGEKVRHPAHTSHARWEVEIVPHCVPRCANCHQIKTYY